MPEDAAFAAILLGLLVVFLQWLWIAWLRRRLRAVEQQVDDLNAALGAWSGFRAGGHGNVGGDG